MQSSWYLHIVSSVLVFLFEREQNHGKILDLALGLLMKNMTSKETRRVRDKQKLNGHFNDLLVGGFNPFEKLIKINWIISPGRSKNKTCFKPPPSLQRRHQS